MNTLTRRSGVFVPALLFACAALALHITPAFANEIHRFSHFQATPLRNLQGVAVDDSSGDVYTDGEEGANDIVAKFDPSGGLVAGFADSGYLDGSATAPGVFGTNLWHFAVDQSNGDLYVSDWRNSLIDKFDADGDLLASFNPSSVLGDSYHAFGLAVSPANQDLYVANTSGSAIDVFNPSGEYQSQFPTIHEPLAVAVAASGEIYVANGNEAVAYGPSGNPDPGFGAGTGLLDQNHAIDLAVDPSTGDIYVDERTQIARYDLSGQRIETIGVGQIEASSEGIAVGPGHNVYLSEEFPDNRIDVFGPLINVPNVTIGSVENPGPTSATLTGEVEPGGAGNVTSCDFQYGATNAYGATTACLNAADVEVGTLANPITSPTAVHADISGLTSEKTYHYDLIAGSSQGPNEGVDHEFTPRAVADLKTEAPTNVTSLSATLNGSFVGNGEDTHYYFEWGLEGSLTNKIPIPPADANSPAGPSPTQVSMELGGLNPATNYQYRVVAFNAHGTSVGGIERLLTPPTAPLVTEFVTEVHSDGALINARINPGGAATKYHVEYGPERCSAPAASCLNTAEVAAGSGTTYESVTIQLSQLAPGTEYHYRVVAVNTLGAEGPESTFTTFPSGGVLTDACPNAHVRQQTGAALLLDCRAYELVSAGNSGGYDVESDLVPGQTPYAGYPEAESPSRVLYAVHDGGIPGTNHPTNRGPDPYVATRGENGWSTEYVGVPANDPFAASPFSSSPSGADSSLDAFAFGGAEGCSPCFAGDYTGIPVREPNGELVQGMSGSINPGPSAKSDGYIAKDLSANGEHFIFGSTAKFAPGGNDESGDVSIYDHNLATGETRVVSDTPEGHPIPCLPVPGKCNSTEHDSNGIAELDISGDGSHILLAQKVAADADGNVYWHLYMNVGDSTSTIDLTPGATDGVLYDGMTADGSKVFFTTKDSLSGTDTDASADLYEAEISGAGATLTQISTGTAGTGNSDACEPVSNENGEHWNTVGPGKDCSVLAIGGGGGVSADGASVYFFSPEQLDGPSKGTANQPNLYLVAPGSATPTFVATLDPDDPTVLDAVKGAETRRTADFQVTSGGRYAAFPTTVKIGEYDNGGHSEIYRYEASGESLRCVSCNPTNALAEGDASLASDGLSLTEDGRVFFDSKDALAPRDLDNTGDAYEWEPRGTGNCQPESPAFSPASNACLGPISTGSSPFPSSLLGVSADGKDVYFFTHDSLAPQDQNGPLAKIYDAREGGGFPYTPPPPLCAASDECHGAGSPPPGPTQIRTLASGPGNAAVEKPEKCKKGFALKHGKCVKKPSSPKHKGHKHQKRAANHNRGAKK